MRLLALAALLGALALPSLAPADPIPTGSRTTCPHEGIESATHHRRADYLHQQYGLSCSFAQHLARIWIHGCASPFSGCNIVVDQAYWYCTATAHATGEYTAACRRNGNTVLIGWVRF